MKSIRIAAWIGVAVALVVLIFVAFGQNGTGRSNSQSGGGDLAGAPIGGPYNLTSHEGSVISSGDFKGRYQLIYFGYTYCPDICPLELQKMSAALLQLEEKGFDTTPVQPIFISVDPERDTVGALAEYVTLFHPRLVGLTGSTDEIKSVAKDFRIYYAKQEDSEATEYLMDHTSLVFLLDGSGKFERFFSGRDTVADIARVLEEIL